MDHATVDSCFGRGGFTLRSVSRDDVETFGLHQRNYPVRVFPASPGTDPQLLIAKPGWRQYPLSYQYGADCTPLVWSAPSSGDYRDPGNIGRCLGTSLSSRAAETRCCCRCRGFAVATLWQKGGCRRRRTSRQSCTGSTPKRVVAARGRRWPARRRDPSVLNEICQVVRGLRVLNDALEGRGIACGALRRRLLLGRSERSRRTARTEALAIE